MNESIVVVLSVAPQPWLLNMFVFAWIFHCLLDSLFPTVYMKFTATQINARCTAFERKKSMLSDFHCFYDFIIFVWNSTCAYALLIPIHLETEYQCCKLHIYACSFKKFLFLFPILLGEFISPLNQFCCCCFLFTFPPSKSLNHLAPLRKPNKNKNNKKEIAIKISTENFIKSEYTHWFYGTRAHIFCLVYRCDSRIVVQCTQSLALPLLKIINNRHSSKLWIMQIDMQRFHAFAFSQSIQKPIYQRSARFYFPLSLFCCLLLPFANELHIFYTKIVAVSLLLLKVLARFVRWQTTHFQSYHYRKKMHNMGDMMWRFDEFVICALTR